ncbi:MAG: carbohydrate kinase [Spirochaetes bacterium]|nr:carbohydrate kinase [Spirochaetota bacterium]
MIIAVGEILFDIFPGYKRLGGAPFNFAVHLKKFGYSVQFISCVGADEDGNEIVEYLKKTGFNTDYIQINQHKTGRVIVTLDNSGVPEYDIIKNAAYDFISYDKAIKHIEQSFPEMIYVGSLIQRTENGYKTIQKILENKKNAVCFYDVNLRPYCYNSEIIESTLKYTDILKVNHEESVEIKKVLNIQGDEVNFVYYIFQKYPVKLIIITRGENGSTVYNRSKSHSISGSNISNLIDTVGAGDAFSSIVAVGYLHSWEIDKINHTASEFASLICGIKGAIPGDKKNYEEFKEKF